MSEVRAPTMADVAMAAGVSKALVSIVFRGAPGASEQTREHVFATARQLGYRANRTASLLKLRRTRHLGVTMTVRSTYHAELVEAIQAAADAAGYDLVLSPMSPSHDEQRAVESLLEHRCEALVLLGSTLTPAELGEVATTQPVVVVGRRVEAAGVDVVRSADDRGVRLAVDHLVGLGHRAIVHVDGGRGAISADRRRGYRAAMRRHGLQDLAHELAGGQQEIDGQRAAEQLVDSDATAVVAFNDRCALGVIDGLARAGRSLSVTGYDNSPLARLAAIDLTSVSQEAAEQAGRAVAAVIDRLEHGRTVPHETVLTPKLIIRGSTRAISS